MYKFYYEKEFFFDMSCTMLPTVKKKSNRVAEIKTILIDAIFCVNHNNTQTFISRCTTQLVFLSTSIR